MSAEAGLRSFVSRCGLRALDFGNRTALFLALAIGLPATVLGQTWTQQSPATSPPARDSAAMVYDSLHHQMVLFGGSNPNSSTPFGDTWVYNGITWTQLSPATSPPARVFHAMAFDAAHGKVVLFGGEDSTGPSPNLLNDTWTFDGTTWHQEVTSSSAPTPRQAPAMAFDAALNQVVLVGGKDASGVTGDTWLWNGTVWGQAETVSVPARRFAALSFDARTSLLILFGGDDGTTNKNDTWTWDGLYWNQMNPAHSPSPRGTEGLAYDPVRKLTVLFGGSGLNDTWTWNGADWTQETTSASPPGRYYVNMSYDTERSNMVLFGGLNASLSGDLNDTWTLGYTYTQSWMLLAGEVQGGPTARVNTAAASQNGSSGILFGGSNGTSLLNETWFWSGNQWSVLGGGSPPSARQSAAMAVQGNGVSLLFGGNASVSGSTPLGDTWTLAGSWTQHSLSTSPPARYGSAMVSDPLHFNIVLFGGLGSGPFNDTWIWDGSSWNQAAPATAPPARSFHNMVYDVAHSQVVLFGGMINGVYRNDTWVWDGSNWTQMTPATSPPARDNFAMVYDSVHGFVEIFGGVNSSGALNDTWLWDGTTWTQLTPPTSPAPRYGMAAGYLGSAGQFFLFGGASGSTLFGDTWIFGSPYVSTATLPTAFYGQMYNYTIVPAGGVGPYTFAEDAGMMASLALNPASTSGAGKNLLRQHPATFGFGSFGLNLDPTTGAITGTDQIIPGQAPVVIGVTISDAQGQSTDIPFELVTDSAINFSPPAPLPDANAAATYNVPLTASGGTPPFTFSATGLPAGITISGGQLTGKCTASSSNVRLTAVDSLSGTLTVGPMALNCNPIPQITTASPLPFAALNAYYSVTLATNAVYDPPGAAPYNWQVTAGELPAGLFLFSDGSISGNPTAVGTLPPFTVTFTDKWGASASKAFTLTVGVPLTISTQQLPLGNLTMAYPAGAGLKAIGGTPAYHFSATGLPGGLSIDPTSGAITGTPTASGTFTPLFTLTDQASGSVQQQIPIIVAAPGTNSLDWLQASPTTVPTGRYAATMFFDPVRHQTVLFGGRFPGEPGVLNDTLTWDGGNWNLLSPANSPSQRGGMSGAFDVAHGVGVIFGGVDGEGISQNDTWTWNGTTWTNVIPSGVTGSPRARSRATMAWDGHQIVLFGGTDGDFDLSDTWIWNGTTWTQVVTPGPGAREGAAMAFDSGRNQVVLFGGIQNDTIDFADTWLWDGGKKTWTQVDPAAPHPSARDSVAMAYDSARSLTVLFGGYDTNAENPLSDTWGWNGTTWAQLLTPHYPAARTGHAMSFDPTFDQVILFGGDDPFVFGEYSDTWLLDGPIVSALTLPAGTIGIPYIGFVQFVAGGIQPLLLAAPSLPPGITFNTANGAFGGTPTAAGDYLIRVNIEDDAGVSIAPQFSLHIFTPITISPSSPLPAAVVQAPYTANFTASGGTPGYTWSATGLPTWLTLSPAGLLSGTPPAGSTSVNFQLSVIDSTMRAITVPYLLPVNNPVSITTASLPLATVNVSYSAPIAASGGVAPYSWSAVGLPAGLTISPAGFLAGTVSVAGTYPITVKVSDSRQSSASKVLSLLVSTGLPLSFVTQSLTSCVVNSSCPSQIVAAGGVPPYVYSLSSGANLGGLSLSSTGALSGIPSSAGQISIPVIVTDQLQASVSKTFTQTVIGTLTIATPSLPSGTVGVTYGTQLSSVGGLNQVSWSVASGTLPPGLSLDLQAGIVYGTPTTAGTFTFSLQVQDSLQTSTPQKYTVTISPPPTALSVVSPLQLTPAAVGTLYLQNLVAIGGSGSYTWTLTGSALPTGLTLATNGLISGTPTTAQIAGFTAKVSDTAGNSVSTPFTLIVTDPTKVNLLTASPLPDGIIGTPYNFAINVSGGTPPYTWSVNQGQLPTGLTFDATTGILSGTPTVKGNFNFVLTVVDSGSGISLTAAGRATATVNYSIRIAGPGDFQITTGQILPLGTLGQSYSTTLAAAGGTPPYKWQLINATPPPGVTLDSTGKLAGTPSVAGVSSLLIGVTDSTGASATGAFQLRIADPNTPALIVIPQPPPGTVGAGYQTTFTAIGGHTPYAWSVASGSLPPGLTLDATAGTITGTPTQRGNFPFTLKATDNLKASSTLPVAIRVNAVSLQISPTSVPNGTANVPYTFGLSVSAGTAPYTWSLSSGGLLSGFSIDPATGVLSGTPTAAGTFPFTITVVDSNYDVATQTYQFVVQGTPLTISTITAPAGTAGGPYSLQIQTTNAAPPLTFSVTSGALPPGLSLGPSTGLLSGTPTSAGSFTFTVQVKDATSATAQATFTLVVSAQPLTVSTTTLPSGGAGTTYSQTLQVSGAKGAVTWTVVTGSLPAGLSLGTTTGIISGTPTAPGSVTFTVQATDSTGASARQTLTVTIGAPPPAPAVTVSGLPATSNAGDQPTVTITLANAYPLPIQVTATLSITPNAANTTDLMFANASRTIQFTIAANTTQSTLSFQAGSLPGTIQLALTLSAAGVNITPSPAPAASTKISAGPPVIRSVTATATGNGLQVVIVGSSTTLDMKTASFHFTAASGSTLQNTDVTVDVSAIFTTWYQSAASQPTGSQFSLTVPFTVGGNVSTIASVSVTLTNSSGTSNSVSANVH